MTAKDQLARRFIFRLFSRIRDERIEIVEHGRRFSFGARARSCSAQVTVHSPHVYRQLLRGSNGPGRDLHGRATGTRTTWSP